MLKLNWSTLLLQIANFVVMVFILWRFFFKTVIRILDERSARVTSALQEAEQKQQQADEMHTEYEQKLAEAQEQSIVMRQQAEEELARTKRDVLDETRQEVETMRERAHSEITEARQQAIYQHRRDLGRLVTTLSARMMRESAGDALQKATIDRFCAELANLRAEQFAETLSEGDPEVVHVQLASAEDLDAATRGRIEGQIKDITGKPIDVKYKVDPSLIAGATVRFGDTVIDGSLAGQLQHLQEQYMGDMEQGNL